MPAAPTHSTSVTEAMNLLTADGPLNPMSAMTELRLQDGRTVRIATATLLQDISPAEDSPRPSLNTTDEEPTHLVVPLVEEQLHVEKRLVETGKLRLHKATETFETHLDEVLAIRTFDVERIVLNVPVESAPEIRQDGETTIYPVVEEQLIVTRQLVLKEEVRVTRRDTERHDTRPITLQRETLQMERVPTMQP